MGNFSRDTFDRLNHYVGVRLQEGAPLVDPDWNENDDIRKFELQAFLKWFVGSGVAEGNDGFRILPAVEGRIILRWNKAGWDGKQPVLSSLEVLIEQSDAAGILGFDAENCYAERMAPPAAQLAGRHGPQDGFFAFGDTAKVLHIKIDDGDPIDIELAGDLTPSQVRDAIANRVTNLEAEVGGDDDFDIKGSSGPGAGPGRCLVEGWDAINESTLSYKAQALYENDSLAAEWGVAPVDPLTTPVTNRTDLVYLDLWEREVDAQEDGDLVNPLIGLETCIRLKREWVLRVAEGAVEPPAPPEGHVHYPLALLHRPEGGAPVLADHIQDRRLTGLHIGSHLDTRQTLRDSFGDPYALDHDGEPNLQVSLREAVNALLRGALPMTPIRPLAADHAQSKGSPIAILDAKGDLWVFWRSHNPLRTSMGIWYRRYRQATGSWDVEQRLPGAAAVGGDKRQYPFAIADSREDLWVFFWLVKPDIANGTWSKRYNHDNGTWGADERVSETTSTTNPRGDTINAVMDGDGDLWAFWEVGRTDTRTTHIYWNRYDRSAGAWVGQQQLTDVAENDFRPSAVVDGNGDVWVFWERDVLMNGTNFDLYYRRFDHTTGTWDTSDNQLTYEATSDFAPRAMIDADGFVWVFWMSSRSSPASFWYKHNRSGSWSGDVRLPTGATAEHAGDPRPMVNASGDIWVFWTRHKGGGISDIWYNRFTPDSGWGRARLVSMSIHDDEYPRPVPDPSGDVWVFWDRRDTSPGATNRDIYYRRFNRRDGTWDPSDTRLTRDAGSDTRPRAIIDADGFVWVFWNAYRAGITHLRYVNNRTGSFGSDIQVTTSSADSYRLFVDTSGDIWVFWVEFWSEVGRSYSNIWYKRFTQDGGWSSARLVTTGTLGKNNELYPCPTGDLNGDPWVFWLSRRGSDDLGDLYHRKLIARI